MIDHTLILKFCWPYKSWESGLLVLHPCIYLWAAVASLLTALHHFIYGQTGCEHCNQCTYTEQWIDCIVFAKREWQHECKMKTS